VGFSTVGCSKDKEKKADKTDKTDKTDKKPT
jgi:hypothetical protein